MNNNEFLDKLNGYLAQINEIAEKANELATEYNKSAEQVEVENPKEYTLNLLKDYVNAFEDKMYWVEFGDMCHGSLAGAEEEILAFDNFPSEAYAKKLRKMNKLNGMMLAFKWCYDRDYEPDWDNDETVKYTVIHHCDCGFHVKDTHVRQYNQVYFRSEFIAEDCAIWLNKVAESEDLI